MARAILGQLVFWFVLNLVLNFSRRADLSWQGHLGGFVTRHRAHGRLHDVRPQEPGAAASPPATSPSPCIVIVVLVALTFWRVQTLTSRRSSPGCSGRLQASSTVGRSRAVALVAPVRAVPRAEIERRLAAFQETLRSQGIDAAVVVQNADLYYLAGTVQQSHLLVPADGEPVLFTRKTVARAREESPLTVEELPSLRRLGELVADAAAARPRRRARARRAAGRRTFAATRASFRGARFVDVGARSCASGPSSRPGRSPASPPPRRSPTRSSRASPACCARA